MIETRPVNEMTHNPNAILDLLVSGPVVLMQRSVPAGVLVSPKEWNSLFDRLKELEDAVETWKGIAAGRDTIAAAKGSQGVMTTLAPPNADTSPRELGTGQWKGKIKIADDFDDLLIET